MRLYVGNLPFSTTDDELKDLFGPYGSVIGASVVFDKMSGRSRGFGFVEFSSADEGNKAIEALHGKDIGGRALTVNEARPKDERPPRSGGGGFGGGGGGGGYRGGGGGGGFRGGGGGGSGFRKREGGFSRDRDRGDRGGRGDNY
jgi:RNA recognition motif-containing protein